MTSRNQVPGRASTSLTRVITGRFRFDSRDSNSREAPSGPLGLTTLYQPPGDGPVAADLVFVHGLNGGSRSTWTKGDASTHFWPKQWLPSDEAFNDVRIHTFGYSAAIIKESILNIPDFSRALLSAIHDAPTIPREEKAPLILVGHSMGGLVIKKAYVIARRTPEFGPLSARITAIFFLGTPHQGADMAETLHRIISLAGSRPFIGDLFPNSPVIQAINKDFPDVCGDLRLFSFFESKPMGYGPGKGLIVQKSSAVLGYSNERRTHLNANHRDVARYTSPNDPSYLTVRNALATLIAAGRQAAAERREEIASKARTDLSRFLGVHEPPDDDLMARNGARLPGSCEWLNQKNSFLEWRQALFSKVFWLCGRPGAGKSVISSYVITYLQGLGLDTSFFFFTQSDKGKDNINSFLRSMVYQMAIMHPAILDAVSGLTTTSKDASADKTDHPPIWRKLFLECILKIKLSRPQYWVLDAIDECQAGEDLVQYLSRIQEFWPVCIFITSRYHIDSIRASDNIKMEVLSEAISEEDTNADIALFLESNITTLHAPAENKQALVRQILEQSKGCFLWACLIQKELRRVHTASGVQKILSAVPSDMDDLYQQILRDMSQSPHDQHLTVAILYWTVCSFRAMEVEELHAAIQIDTGEEIGDAERLVTACCGNLVYVDRSKRVQLLHLTARELLTNPDLESEFRIDLSQGHHRLAMVCLKHLTGAAISSLRPSPLKRSSLSSLTAEKSPFSRYASEYMFNHLANIRPDEYEDETFRAVAGFLSSYNSLRWIEYVAKESDIQKVSHAGKILAAMVHRRRQTEPPLNIHKEIDLLDRFSTDLTHLVTKYGRRLRDTPSSIYQLIPPFCPPSSAIRRQFWSPYRGIRVQGLSVTDWDDCLSTISYSKPTRPLSAAVSSQYTVVGASTGKIYIYDDETHQERHILENRGIKKTEPVWKLEFGKAGNFLASAGSKSINIWSVEKWEKVHTFATPSLCLAMSFVADDTVLYVALKSNQLVCWDVATGELLYDPVDWARDSEDDGEDLPSRQPILATFAPHLGLLAIAYRGEDLILWDLEGQVVHDIYEKETGSRSRFGRQAKAKGTATVSGIAFSAAVDPCLLAVTYTDGDLAVYNLEQESAAQLLCGVCAQVISSSADGRTLAVGDTQGCIKLFDFETLELLYCINLDADADGASSLLFTADSLRLVEVRGRHCRVWDPSVLLRQNADEEARSISSVSIEPLKIDYRPVESPTITAMACVWSAAIVFCGKDDGTIHVYDMTGDPHSQLLFTQTANSTVFFLHFDPESGLLTASDTGSRVTSRVVSRVGGAGQATWEVSPIVIDTRAGAAISQIAAWGKQSRLLVSSHDHSRLWAFGGQSGTGRCLGSVDGYATARWAIHYPSPAFLVCMRESTAQVYLRSTFECVATVSLIGAEEWTITRVVPRFHQQYAITVSDSRDRNLGKAVQIWDVGALSAESSALAPIFVLDREDVQVEEVLGILGNRLIFIDIKYWVCSVNINLSHRHSPLPSSSLLSSSSSELTPRQAGSWEADEVTRYFFLPHDWISLATKLDVDICKGGEVLFIRRSEVAVIKKGFSIREQGSPGPSRASSPGFKLPMRPLLRKGPGTHPE